MSNNSLTFAASHVVTDFPGSSASFTLNNPAAIELRQKHAAAKIQQHHTEQKQEQDFQTSCNGIIQHDIISLINKAIGTDIELDCRHPAFQVSSVSQENPANQYPHIHYYATTFNELSRTLSPTIHHSTLSPLHRQEWPAVYIPVNSLATSDTYEEALTIIRHINEQLHAIKGRLQNVSALTTEQRSRLSSGFYFDVLVQIFLIHWHNCYVIAPLSDNIIAAPLSYHGHSNRRRINPKYNSRRHHELKRQIRIESGNKESKHMPRDMSSGESPRDIITRPLTPRIQGVYDYGIPSNPEHIRTMKFSYDPLIIHGTNPDYPGGPFDWSRIKRQDIEDIPAILNFDIGLNKEQISLVIADIEQYQHKKVGFNQRRDILMDDAMPYFQQALEIAND